MTDAVVVVCLVAGLATVGFAFFALARDKQIREKIENTVGSLSTKAEVASELGPKQGGSLAETTTQQASVLTGGAEYVKALAELAGNLSKVSQAVAALLISTIPLAIAAAVVLVD